MLKPNFFIVGAPKCGTTSLAHWLSEHPAVFMSTPKELHYFNFDSDHHSILTINDYEKIFKDAKPHHKAVGEASVWYLLSNEAASNILKYQDKAKFIVCLRNPIEMSVSLHNQLKYVGDENIEQFEAAWNAQGDRLKNKNVPKTCKDPRQLIYGESCKLGLQLQHLIQTVGEDKVLTVFIDDLKCDPKREYHRVLEFIGVENDLKESFPVINIAKRTRIQWLRTYSRRWFLFKQKKGWKFGFGLANFLDGYNKVERERLQISEQMQQKLREHFINDIALLSAITNRDLTHWLK